MKTRTIILLIIVFGILLALMMSVARAPQPAAPAPAASSSITAHYTCDGGKTIDAQFFEGSSTPVMPGQPPIPGGSAHVVLSDGREMTLKQTISADGVRYANADESFVFWSKGDGALVLEHGAEGEYTHCTALK